MHKVLYHYDIYPKVFLGDCEQTVTIQPLGTHVKFRSDVEYQVEIIAVAEGNQRFFPERNSSRYINVKISEDGCLRICTVWNGEGEHLIFVREEKETNPILRCSVYSLYSDMAGRIPLRGDLHMHTCESDGKEGPAFVAAHYRGYGYDFLAITDHYSYYPSLEAMEALDGVSDFTLVPGEEVHSPFNDLHYVNFGGTYSINALITPNPNQKKAGDDLKYRSINGVAPETMSKDEFKEMLHQRAKTVELEHESERLWYVNLEWIYEHIKKNEGLGIFVHPDWRCPAVHVPEEFTEFIYKKRPFDAFEVLGGESMFSHNGYQTAFYYEMKAQGYDYPIVGSTDSHGCTEYNANACICSTIVFAKENTKEALIQAIKEKHSVAVDTISKEYRLVGDYRLMKYASFLMEYYFPLHDEVCKAEGYYLGRYLAGDEKAKEILAAMKGQIPAMQQKYIAV